MAEYAIFARNDAVPGGLELVRVLTVEKVGDYTDDPRKAVEGVTDRPGEIVVVRWDVRDEWTAEQAVSLKPVKHPPDRSAELQAQEERLSKLAGEQA